MATSRSDEAAGWRAGASVFSGRADPTWELSEAAASRIVELWQSLPPWDGEPPAPPPLGYRGCFARSPTGEEWAAYGGAVTRVGPEAPAPEHRADRERLIERLLLETAPEGAVPADFLAGGPSGSVSGQKNSPSR